MVLSSVFLRALRKQWTKYIYNVLTPEHVLSVSAALDICKEPHLQPSLKIKEESRAAEQHTRPFPISSHCSESCVHYSEGNIGASSVGASDISVL